MMTMSEKSWNEDAVCNRKRMNHKKIFDFFQKKLNLGTDTRHKVALIAQEMTGEGFGEGFNVHNFDAEKAADVIGAYVNHMYNDLFSHNKKTIISFEDNPKRTLTFLVVYCWNELEFLFLSVK
ncbi:hypothetical protein MZP33_004382 [Escherichia coli]|nr:hypothetical protein [Escherichia coli]